MLTSEKPLCSFVQLGGYQTQQTILASVSARVDRDSEAVPSLELGRDDVMAMRRGCLLYLLDHEDVESIRHDAISVVITGEGRARLRYLIGAWTWC
jgi:hypothetical protein